MISNQLKVNIKDSMGWEGQYNPVTARLSLCRKKHLISCITWNVLFVDGWKHLCTWRKQMSSIVHVKLTQLQNQSWRDEEKKSVKNLVLVTLARLIELPWCSKWLCVLKGRGHLGHGDLHGLQHLLHRLHGAFVLLGPATSQLHVREGRWKEETPSGTERERRGGKRKREHQNIRSFCQQKQSRAKHTWTQQKHHSLHC